MLSGDEIRAARDRAKISQEELGRQVGVSMRTIGNWERGTTVPRARRHALNSALREHLDGDTDEPALRAASDVELLAEIARRLARTSRQERDGTPMKVEPINMPTGTDAVGVRLDLNAPTLADQAQQDGSA